MSIDFEIIKEVSSDKLEQAEKNIAEFDKNKKKLDRIITFKFLLLLGVLLLFAYRMTLHSSHCTSLSVLDVVLFAIIMVSLISLFSSIYEPTNLESAYNESREFLNNYEKLIEYEFIDLVKKNGLYKLYIKEKDGRIKIECFDRKNTHIYENIKKIEIVISCDEEYALVFKEFRVPLSYVK